VIRPEQLLGETAAGSAADTGDAIRLRAGTELGRRDVLRALELHRGSSS
jgi:hypothetical protein